ncbi:prominin-like protein [Drosophila innubila]|uniref:prominin-like protein n=1 Tax=Drosophila innubila TaxID=198719 RepID=UPI00148D0A1F|nr:prominin-like protein [Drosophila innubila]
MILWILPLLILIIIMPFIATIYCCFCCWRCNKSCAPCNKPSHTKRLIYSLLLFFLIPGLLLGFTIAMLSHKQMSRNVGYTIERMQRGSKDTCAFLKDVSLHLHHLLIKNMRIIIFYWILPILLMEMQSQNWRKYWGICPRR